MSKDRAMLNAFDPASADGLDDRTRALIARRERLLAPSYRLFYERPLHVVRGEGVWLFDVDGRRYLDAYNNVVSVGHAHPAVVRAIANQAAVLNTHTRYLHESVLDTAEALLATMPDTPQQMLFTCTGSEANDAALRIARAATGGTGVIVTQLAYHGVTAAVSEISPSLAPTAPRPPHVRVVPAPDTFRIADVATALAADVGSAIADLLAHGIRPAALIVDTLFTSDGVFSDPAGFLAPAVDAIHAAGGLFIADEVQAGMGRSGSTMWGFQRHGVVPDLVTMGKPLGNGHPVAAVAGRPEVLLPFGAEARYFNTFGGNPVAMAAALATLRVMQDEGLQANAAAVGAHLRAGFRQLAAAHPVIADVRGDGLFLGVELDDGTPRRDLTAAVVNGMRERGVLISATGVHGNVLKLRPPLVLTREQANLLLSVADEALTAVGA